ncbi:isocitrate lyase/phosphoenolpyruvate mutase family protein [Streptomyces sp. A3M-1-3]|uniref:isocitrate lyase/PEP mutase family protein n=1 Tax=Streptomyces sp. A3M-1-3 TaxID=2962044 RepID=UPI0020B7EAAF|nr:isocitrate lyase/phosphoenolpyruvate mutase family protein [Streptomyces sp. A3M-1-3]MCP3822580.1 isocitrate lyase/phosphoenolpyruvate mutase family protein [Streptomyces sp. A3M-1-3]
MSRYEEFRALHRPGAPLLLPNAWDHACAAALAQAGFAAIGTTSLGVASAAGKPDATGDTREETLRLGRGLARLAVPVSVDIEGGFSEQPAEVAALAAELVRAGVAGVNIEDGRPDGSLADAKEQCELIRAVKEAAPELFVNARTDTYWLPGHRERTSERLAAYQQAGADGLFVPGLQDERTIGALARELTLPLNILFAPGGLTVARLAELGVARISTGSLLFRAAVHGAVELARAVARGDAEAADLGELPSYDRAQAWAGAFSS